jgi:hypothetical protein
MPGQSSAEDHWFRRRRRDGRMTADAFKGDNNEVFVLDDGWAASFVDGRWHLGIKFSHEHMAEFTPIKNREESERLSNEAHAALVGPDAAR